jgi:hypothetical protein
MYRVTSTHLGPDARRTRTADDELDRGEMSVEELTLLFDSFVEIDAADNEEHDPYVSITGRGAKLIVRTSRGRLQVYDARDHAAPAVEMTVPAIFQRLDKGSYETNSPFPSPDGPQQLPPTAPHRGIALAMLVVGLALNGYILYSVFYVESVNKKVEVKLVLDPDEIKAKVAAVAGVYATGGRTGDRVIEVDSAGGVRFYEIGQKGPINDSKDTYQVGRHEAYLCLSTRDNGVIDLVGDTLVYYRDVYSRRKPLP